MQGNLRDSAVLLSVIPQIPDPVCKSKTAVGIDLGVVRFATIATEETEQVIAPLEVKNLETKISWNQKKLSRKKKFSKKMEKTKTLHPKSL